MEDEKQTLNLLNPNLNWISDDFFELQEISIDEIRREWKIRTGKKYDLSTRDLFYSFSKACKRQSPARILWEKFSIRTSTSQATADGLERWGPDGRFGLANVIQSGVLASLRSLTVEYMLDFGGEDMYELCEALNSGKLPKLRHLRFQGVQFKTEEVAAYHPSLNSLDVELDDDELDLIRSMASRSLFRIGNLADEVDLIRARQQLTERQPSTEWRERQSSTELRVAQLLQSWVASGRAENLESLHIADTDMSFSNLSLIVESLVQHKVPKLYELELSICSSFILTEGMLGHVHRGESYSLWRHASDKIWRHASDKIWRHASDEIWRRTSDDESSLSSCMAQKLALSSLKQGRLCSLQNLTLGSRSAIPEELTVLLKCPQLRTLSRLSIFGGTVFFRRSILIELAAALASHELQNLEFLELDGELNSDETEVLFASMETGSFTTLRTLAFKDTSKHYIQASLRKCLAIAKWLQSGNASNLSHLQVYYAGYDVHAQTIPHVTLVNACLGGNLPNLETIDFGDAFYPEEQLLKLAMALEVGELPQLKKFLFLRGTHRDIRKSVQRAFINAYKRNKVLVADLHEDLHGRAEPPGDKFLLALHDLKARNAQHAQILGELSVAGQPFVPGTHGKVFLCGNPHVGKTTLLRTLQRSSTWQTNCGSRRFWFHSATAPTRGIEVNHMKAVERGADERPLELTFWDMAGQREYEVLHSAFLPDLALANGRATFFIIVCSSNAQAGSSVDTARDSLYYWLKFIASNSPRGISKSLRRQVLVVLNCFKGRHEGHDQQEWNDILADCQQAFEEFLSLHARPFIINAKKPQRASLSHLESHLQTEARRVLEQRKVPLICENVLQSCKEWASNETNKEYPVLQWQQFRNSVGRAFVSEKMLIAAIVYLHEAGHLILFKKAELQDFSEVVSSLDQAILILTPEWFCQRVIGHLLLPDSLLTHGEKSLRSTYMRGDDSMPLALVQKHQFRISEEKCEQMVDILVRLGLGYTLANDRNSVFIPALIRDDKVPAEWLTDQGHEETSSWVVGFSLLCRDSLRTLLPVDVFRKLQINLAQDENVGRRADSEFRAGISRISCKWRGMMVVVEYHSDPKKPWYNRLDILVKSQNSEGDTAREKQVRLAQVIVSRTLDVTADCCHGLELKRFVIKPWMCADGFRHLEDRDVRFSVEDMTDQLRKGIEHSMGYDEEDELFATNWKVGSVFVKFRDVLAEEDWRSVTGVFETRSELAESALETLLVVEPIAIIPQDVSKGPEVGSSSSAFEKAGAEDVNTQLLLRLRSDIRALRHEMRIGMDQLNNSIKDVTRRVEDMLKLQVNINTQIQSLETFTIMEKQTSVPRFMYLTGRQGKQWALPRVQDGFSEETFLHFWCEAGIGHLKMHEVKGQNGVDVRYLKKRAKQLAPILSWSLKIGFVAAKVAGSAVLPGLGILLPDNLNTVFQNATRMADGMSELLKMCSGFVDESLGQQHVTPEKEKELRGAARAFVKEILKKLNPQEFKQQVGLTRVRIADGTGGTEKVAWICHKCCDKLGGRAQELDMAFS